MVTIVENARNKGKDTTGSFILMPLASSKFIYIGLKSQHLDQNDCHEFNEN